MRGSRGWAAPLCVRHWTTSVPRARRSCRSVRSSAAGSRGTPTTPTWCCTRTDASEDLVAVHLAERVGDELDAGAVGVAEVHRDAAVHDVLDAGVGEPLHQLAPALRVDADGHVVQPAEHLGVGADVQAGEVEEGDEVAVANVEEEMRRARVV